LDRRSLRARSSRCNSASCCGGSPPRAAAAVAELGGERKPTVPAGRTSRPRIGAGDRSAGVAAVPARRAWPRDTRMPGVGAPPHVATRADIANRYRWVAIVRAGRHDYSSSARSSGATARSLDRRSGGMMAVTAQVVPREHRVSEFAEASRARRPVSPELLEDVLDGPENSHDLPPIEAIAGLTIRILPRPRPGRALLRFQLPDPSGPPRRRTPPGHLRSGSCRMKKGPARRCADAGPATDE